MPNAQETHRVVSKAFAAGIKINTDAEK